MINNRTPINFIFRYGEDRLSLIEKNKLEEEVQFKRDFKRYMNDGYTTLVNMTIGALDERG
jgi:hypothetical protein